MLVWQLQEPFCSYYEPVSTLLQIQKIYFVGTNKKRDFYELWQQHKLSKTIKMSEVSPDTYDEGYMHQFQPKPTHKIH